MFTAATGPRHGTDLLLNGRSEQARLACLGVSSSACTEDDTMTPPHSHHAAACRCGPRTSAPADAPHSVVRVKGSAGPVKGELEVTSSEPQGSPVSTAIAILVLVTASALAAVAIGVAGWLAGELSRVCQLNGVTSFPFVTCVPRSGGRQT